jgi:hypothetical protein
MGMSCAFNSPVSTRPLPSSKTNVFINHGLSRMAQVYAPENVLNFFSKPQASFSEEEMRNRRKQNNHKTRSANRRERRVNPNLRVRNGRYLRTVAKTPAVQILTVSNVPSDVLDAIDQLAAGQDRSRSSFVRRELQRIVSGYRTKAA